MSLTAFIRIAIKTTKGNNQTNKAKRRFIHLSASIPANAAIRTAGHPQPPHGGGRETHPASGP